MLKFRQSPPDVSDVLHQHIQAKNAAAGKISDSQPTVEARGNKRLIFSRKPRSMLKFSLSLAKLTA